ncbi:hypothetical protein [Haloplanus salilacus]|uniref:hypothetical protein n=1 Tax=Haloplanus salilacus TaxID=2949994 RepID=UPI0030CB221C
MSTDPPSTADTTWYRALFPDELPDGRVTTANCGDTTVAITHYDGEYAALDTTIDHDGPALVEIVTDSDPV